MKTAISIPDDLFERADRLARRLKKSRSALYRAALEEYVARHASDAEVTEALNRLADEVDTRPDAFMREAARRTLASVEWETE